MILKLMKYLNTTSATVKREDVLKTLTFIMSGIHNDTIPALSDVIKNADTNNINDNVFLTNLSIGTILKSKNNKDFLVKLKAALTNISKLDKELVKLVETGYPEYMSNITATAKQVTIMKLISDIGTMSYYTLDLLYYILIQDSETTLPKVKLNEIRSTVGDYTSIINAYGKDFRKVIDNVSQVGDVEINKKASVSMMDKLISSSGKTVLLASTDGFINNPIYHVRMWLVDDEIEKYESLKDKKKLIELKLLELKLNAKQQSNPKLKQQIEYYEEKLSGIEYDIKDIEDN